MVAEEAANQIRVYLQNLTQAQRRDIANIVAAYDVRTGNIKIATNAGSGGETNPGLLHPVMEAALKEANLTIGQRIGNSIVGRCAELRSINELLHSGSSIEDIRINYPLRGRGVPNPKGPCDACRVMLQHLGVQRPSLPIPPQAK